MPIIIKEKKYELADEGLHDARITSVEDAGVYESQYGAKERIKITFEMLDQKDKENKPIEVQVFASKSIGAKSTLFKLLSQLGISAKGQFDAEELVGITCQVVVVHRKNNDGTKTFANIDSIVPKRRGGLTKPATTDEI